MPRTNKLVDLDRIMCVCVCFFFGSVESEVSSRCASVQKVRSVATIWQCQSVTSGSRPCQDFHTLKGCVRCLGRSACAL